MYSECSYNYNPDTYSLNCTKKYLCTLLNEMLIIKNSDSTRKLICPVYQFCKNKTNKYIIDLFNKIISVFYDF